MKKAALCLAALVIAAPALAQAPAAPARKAPTGSPLPKTGIFLYSNACQIMPADDAFGFTVRLTRAATGDTLVFAEPQDGPRVATPGTDVKVESPAGRPVSDISFTLVNFVGARQFTGTVSTTEIKLTQQGVENPETITLPIQANTFRPGDCL